MKYEIIVLKWKKNRLNFIYLNISINFLFHLALDIIMAEAYEKVYTIQIAYNSLSQYMKETHVDNECKNAVNVLGSQWMELVLLPKILENHECIFELKESE